MSNPTSEICKFYREKTLFITGAAGFLGMVLLETLLTCCPDIRRIYILLRAKKGVQPEDRKEALFQKEIFQKLRAKDPNVFNKVILVTGDIAFENLGMSEAELLKVTREVSVVFHCAAAITFMKPLSFMLQQNLLGTNNVIEVCKKMQNFEVLVYTSTFYSNCNYKIIEEKVYDLPFTIEEAVKLARHGTEEELLKLMKMCKPSFPNYYIFSKCLTENLLLRNFADVPSCIVRPSIIICCYKGSLPGFIENGTGFVSLCVGIGKGFIRVVRIDPDKRCNLIPADIVANTHIIAAFNQATQRLPSLTVYNCTSDEKTTFTWNHFIRTLLINVEKYPLPRAYQKPGLIITKSAFKYWIASLFDHYIPATVIDILMWMTGRKLRLLKLYKLFDKSMDALSFFTLTDWDKKMDNFLSISEKLNSTDKELFPVALDFSVEGISTRLITGSPQYKAKDSKPHEERQRITYLRFFFTSMIKWSVLVGLASIFYVVIF